jgi:hypothetical protein
MPCSLEKAQFFEVTSHWEYWAVSELHDVTSQKTVLFIELNIFTQSICGSCLLTVGPGMQSHSSQIHSTDDCLSWEIPWSLDLWFCG